MKKLPIGIQSFERLIKDNYYYVDKTEYIWKLITSGKAYFLSRPRRFGKSLLVSTIEAYFEGKKDLFTGLKIESLELTKPVAEQWESYPVIKFSLSGGQYDVENGLADNLSRIISESAENHEINTEDLLGSTLPVRFQSLIHELKKKTGLPVVVLVDEYDKPMLVNLLTHSEVLEKNRALYKGFFSGLKDVDEDIKFVFFTGVTKFSKVSIFSDLNQLQDISLRNEYSAICGITEKELTDDFEDEINAFGLSNGLDVKETVAQLKNMYDGYHFSADSEGIYNPFSLLNSLSSKKFGRYWFETGTPTFLVEKLISSNKPVQDLSDGVQATEQRLSQYRADDLDFVPLFYQSGYLTITGYDKRFNEYTLSYPNDEVKYGFLESLIPMINASVVDSPDDSFSARAMIMYLKKNETDSFMRMLKALLSSIPYYEGTAPSNEQQWRNILYAVFEVLGQYVRAEVHSSRGRSDCILENEKDIYIFEFKQDKTAEEALSQINDKGYAEPYLTKGKTIIKIGVNFSSSLGTIEKWVVG